MYKKLNLDILKYLSRKKKIIEIGSLNETWVYLVRNVFEVKTNKLLFNH